MLAPHGNSKCHCCINFLENLDQGLLRTSDYSITYCGCCVNFSACGRPPLQQATWRGPALNLRTRDQMVGLRVKGHLEVFYFDPGEYVKVVRYSGRFLLLFFRSAFISAGGIALL